MPEAHLDWSGRISTLVEPEVYEEYFKEIGNPISQNFQASLDEAFTEDILPERSEFERSASKLYTPKRIWLEGEKPELPEGWEDHYYEEVLFQLFWRKEFPALIFINGDVGCGKTTLVKYFARCYCPSNPNRAPIKSGENILVLHVNVRSKMTISAFDNKFYDEMHSSINKACMKKNFQIDMDNDYAMYDESFYWEKDIHKMARGKKTVQEYRASVVSNREFSNKEWVELALKHISKSIKSGNRNSQNPFTAVALCIDNIDQSPFEVQAHVMSLVRDWMHPASEINIKKYIIPFWPCTLDIILHEVEPLPKYREVKLGPVLQDSLIKKRNQRIEIEIDENTDSIKWTGEGGDVEEDFEVSNEQCRAFIHSVLLDSSGYFNEFLQDISGGSARRQLELWELAISSRVLYRHYHLFISKEKGDKDTTDVFSVSTYYLFDAMLTGKHLVHNRMTHPIVNLFYTTPEIRSPRDFLIGLHIFSLLSEHNITSQTRIEDILAPLGYKREMIGIVLDLFRKKHFFQWKSWENKEHFIFFPNVLNAYEQLLKERVYIENMAMISPVFRDNNERMKHTRSFEVEDFIPRVMTALDFLVELCHAERAFCLAGLCPNIHDEELFRKTLRDIKLPWYTKKLATAYREELIDTRSYLRGPRKELLQREWGKIMNHWVFKEADALGEYLEAIDEEQPS